MSTPSRSEAIVRAALHAALHSTADSIEPSPDGLVRIRARLQRRRPAPVAVALAIWTELFRRAPAWLQDAVYSVANALGLVRERFGPVPTSGRHRSRADGWLRPLAAMGVVMFIVGVGTYMAVDASTGIFPSSANSQPGGGTHPGGHKGAPGPGSSLSGNSESVFAHSPSAAASPSCMRSTSKATTSRSPAASRSCLSSSPKPISGTIMPSPTPSSVSPSPSPSASSSPSIAPSSAPSSP